MKTRYIILIIFIIAPFFFLKSSKLSFYKDYPELSTKSNNSLIIDSTVYSFQDSFQLKVEAYGYITKDLKFSHQSPVKNIVLDEKNINVKFKINPYIKPYIKVDNKIIQHDKSVSLIKGEYDLYIEDDGFFPINRKLNIDKYLDQLVIPIIQKKINKELVITSDPTNAHVFINNELVGDTPISTNLVSFNNTISIKKENYITKTFKITSNDNESISKFVSIKPKEELLKIVSIPPKASVFINNIYKGITPLSLSKISKGVIEVKKEGYITENIDIQSNTKNIKLYLEPNNSLVSIRTNPNSNFYLNDKFIGETPLDIDIQKLKQKITFKKTGYKTETFYFEPKNNSESLSQRLITVKQDAIYNSPAVLKNQLGLNLILFKPGNVTLGSSKNQSRRGINEIIRNVNISKHFYISENLISEKLYSIYDQAISRSSNLPINNISWIEAAKYCNWLSEKEGYVKFYQIESNNLISFNMKSNGYRLPTESEWEYVAKSNSDQELIYTWGEDRNIKSAVGNIADESASGIFESYIKYYDDGYDMRSPIGQFSANQNGLKDLTGNLSEWTNDFYSAEIVSPDSIFTNYIGPKYGSAHVIKGSNYSSSYPLQLGISYRAFGLDGDALVGFRVARWIY